MFNQKKIILPKINIAIVLFTLSFTAITLSTVSQASQDLSNRLSGKILLQVEENGEAYYYHPDKLELFYLGRPADAFAVMREQGIGISNDNLLKIKAADTTALKNTFSQVDSDGDGYSDYIELINNFNPYGPGRLNYDLDFSQRNSGKIFLQVEENGEAWYVNPDNLKRYFLGRPNDAFEIMRTLGLGISNQNLINLGLNFNLDNNDKKGFNCGDPVEFTYREESVTCGSVSGQNNTCWLDRNLGASQVCTSFDDEKCYGDLFQWGRGDDGHQIRTSYTIIYRSLNDTPEHANFITTEEPPYDWRSPQNNNLWQGVDGKNNPCPKGWRIPTEYELENEMNSWMPETSNGAFNSSLKWSVAGGCDDGDGSLLGVGSYGGVWSSTVSSPRSRALLFHSSGANVDSGNRAFGLSVRCLRD